MNEVPRNSNAEKSDNHKPAGELLPQIYDEFRRLAASKRENESPDQTLQKTALVQEAWLRLAGKKDSHWQSHLQFVAAAAEAMRHILIDNARRKSRLRHGKGLIRVNLDCVDLASQADEDTLLRVDE